MKYFLFSALLFLYACSDKIYVSDKPALDIIGIWTDGQTENATFQIKKDSIYYVDHLENYFYRMESDSISIHYPDMIFKAKVLMKKDTLVLQTSEANYKYWKFK